MFVTVENYGGAVGSRNWVDIGCMDAVRQFITSTIEDQSLSAIRREWWGHRTLAGLYEYHLCGEGWASSQPE